MTNKFVFTDNSLKQKLKNSVPFIGGGLLVVVILALLIVPERIKNLTQCDDLGLGGGFSTIFTGNCTKSFNEIIFVVGDTRNSPAPELKYPEYINTALNLSKASISAISVSNANRNPKLIAAAGDYKKADKFKEASEKYIREMSAKNNGADYLGAIITAAESAENKNRTLIYVVGSGLSDKGLLNFPADGGKILGNSTEEDDVIDKVVDYIDDNGILKGITIVWDGIGQTVPPQKPLYDRKKLERIYAGIFQGLGSSKNNIKFHNKLNGEESVFTDAIVEPTPTNEPKIDITEVYSSDKNSTLQFNGNSATFVDYSATTSEINRKVEEAKSHPSAIITITAYVSRGGCNSDIVDEDLLSSRLNVIRDEFISRGIDQKRIKTIAGGIGPAPECANGVYNEAEGAKNRSVVINIKN